MTRIFEDCFECLISFQHFQQWQEYLKIVSNALLHSHIYTNDKNIWRLFQVPDYDSQHFQQWQEYLKIVWNAILHITHLHQWQEYLEIVSSAWHHSNIFNNEKNIWRLYQMLYYTQIFTPMTRIFGDCFKCQTSFQHFQQWQGYLKFVSNALLHSDIYTNDKNNWGLFQVPDIIPTFSTITRIFEDCTKCLTTLTHLHQWQEYLEIVSSARHHSHIFNKDKNFWRLFRVPDIIPTFSTVTRIFGDCFKCLTSFQHFQQWLEHLKIVSSAWHHSNIFSNDKNIWRLYQMPYYIHTFTPMTRIFGDCFKCLTSFQHFQQWQEYLKIVSNALLNSDFYTNDKNIWRLFQVPDIIPIFSTMTRIFEDCFKCLTSFQHFQHWQEYLKFLSSAWHHSNIFNNDKSIWRLYQMPYYTHTLHQWQEYLKFVSSAWQHSNIFNNDKNIWRLYQMPHYTQTFTPMIRIFEDCFKCLTSFQHFQQWQEYLEIVSNAWYIPIFSTMTRIFEDFFECLTSFQLFQQWQEYLEIVSNAWHHSHIFNND